MGATVKIQQAAATVQQEDEQRSGLGTLGLLKEVTAHMREHGVRRVWIARGALELEVELDPASQFLEEDKTEPSAEQAQLQIEEKRAKGLCISTGCDKKGGHLGQPYCRTHFHAEMNGAQTT